MRRKIEVTGKSMESILRQPNLYSGIRIAFHLSSGSTMVKIAGMPSNRLKTSLWLSWFIRIGKMHRKKSFVLSQPAVRPGMKGIYMPRLSAEKRKKIKNLAASPDRDIDFSDIPEIREIPSDAVIGKFYRPKKETVTIRIDSDVLAWLKASGCGYQTRINNFLRMLMQRSRAQ